MPYGGTTKKQDQKIEDCVSKVMATGKDKVAAIKICKSNIMDKMEKQTFTYTPTNEIKFLGKKVSNVHIFKPGEYRGMKWTKKTVEKIVENFKSLREKAGFQPPVRIGHRGDDSVENAKSVIGYIEDIKCDESGNLYADTEIFDEDNIENFKRLKRSIELGPYETNEGEEFDTTVWGLGLVDIPQVERLAEVNVYSKPLMEEKMAKEEEKTTEEVEESKEESEETDSAEETPKEEDEKVDLDKEEADDDDKDESEEPDKVELDKKSEMVEMSKEEVEELRASREKLVKINLTKRMDKIDAFSKEAKIIPAMLEKEKEFVETLSDEQFDKYVELKEKMPNLVELDKEFGEQKSENEDKEAEEKKVEYEKRVTNAVIDNIIRNQGVSREEAEKMVK